MNLGGKTVLLTGATGGIGRAFAQALADQGARLILVSRNPQELSDLQQCLAGEDHQHVAADLSQTTDRKTIVDACAEGVDIVVNNAGVNYFGLLQEQTEAQLRQMFELNTLAPILLVQAPPAPDERRFYQHVLATIGAPMWGRHTVSELEVRALSHLRDMDLKMLMIDEVHNLLAGSYREQRRFLNMLRFLANDLCASLVVFGVNEALEAIRGDDQLARRLDEHFLPLWEDDVEFSRLIQTLITAMALERRSGLTVGSLRTILNVTGGVTSRVFTMIKSLAIDAIESGEERITDEAVQTWQPVWAKNAWSVRRHQVAELR